MLWAFAPMHVNPIKKERKKNGEYRDGIKSKAGITLVYVMQ